MLAFNRIAILCFTCMLMLYLPCNGQRQATIDSINCSNHNQKDSLGHKYGLWIEDEGYSYCYYKNDKLNGPYVSYQRENGKLLVFGEYSDGCASGKWWYFINSSGHLSWTEENIEVNTKYIRTRDDGVEVKPGFTCYIKDYYPNGMLEKEGQVLYDEAVIVSSYKIGKWKYYNEKGILTETKQEHGARHY